MDKVIDMITVPEATFEFMVRHVKRVDGLIAKLDEIRELCEFAQREERGRCRAFATHLILAVLDEPTNTGEEVQAGAIRQTLEGGK